MNIESFDTDKVYYLASPYSHPSDELKNLRYEAVNRVGAILCKRNLIIIEPIAMCHMKSLQYDLPTGYEYWKTRDRTFVKLSDGGVIVLAIPGWRESVGVSDEVQYARELGHEVYYLTLTELGEHVLLRQLEELELQYKRSIL